MVTSWENPVKAWRTHGLECCIREGPEFAGEVYNGYVRLPEEYRGQRITYDELNESVEVHGGLTHGMDDDGWVGFDTLHAGDSWPGGKHNSAGGTCWTMDKLTKEVEHLAEQLASMTGDGEEGAEPDGKREA